MEKNVDKRYKHRLGEKTITVVKADGEPVANREFTIKQTGHQFLFGSTAFEAIPLVNNELDAKKTELAKEIFQKYFEVFNYSTLPFYWGRFEPAEGKPGTERYKKASEWLISKGNKLKGHPLCWHTVTAPWLLERNNEQIFQMQLDRIYRDVTDFAGLVDIWDVINEAVIMPIFKKYDNGITRLCKDMGRIPLIRELFQATRKANPDAILLINDFETSESYDILIEGCLESGIAIDAIGIQSHMHQGYWGVDKTLEILERFSRFKLPIHFTEVTLVSGKIMPPEIVDLNDYVVDSWPSTQEGEERQAEEISLHYKTLFAHPLVESITYWNFVDGGWLGAPAGLLRKDGSIKPSYEQLHKLIKSEWWTGEKTYITDETGTINITGFYGDYEIHSKGIFVDSFKLSLNNLHDRIVLK